MSALVTGGILAAVVGGTLWATRTKPKPKKKRTDGVIPPAVAIYEYVDTVIIVWKQPKADPSKGLEFAWAVLQQIDVLDVKASRDPSGKKWAPPVQIFRYSGAAKSLADAKAQAQAAADQIAGGLTPPLLKVYDYAGHVIAIYLSNRDPAKPVEWLVFVGGTIDSVASSQIDGKWVPPDGVDVLTSGRATTEAIADADARRNAGQLEGSGGPGPIAQPTVHAPSVSLDVLRFYGDADPSKLSRLPAVDEAVASADLGTVAVGPLWWDRFGNMVGFMLHNGITDSIEIRDAVMRNALPGAWNKNGVGIDELRNEVRAAIADAKQNPPQHPNA